MAEGDRLQQGTSRQRSQLALAPRSPATLQLQLPQVCHRAPACLLHLPHASNSRPAAADCHLCSLQSCRCRACRLATLA